jgi:hypothetical protein
VGDETTAIAVRPYLMVRYEAFAAPSLVSGDATA